MVMIVTINSFPTARIKESYLFCPKKILIDLGVIVQNSLFHLLSSSVGIQGSKGIWMILGRFINLEVRLTFFYSLAPGQPHFSQF